MSGVPGGRPRRWPWLVPAALYAAAIFALSSESHPLPALTARVNDKLLHLTEYGGFAAVLTWGLAALGVGPAAWRWAVVIAAAYGLTDELHQSFVPLRSCELGDWLADAGGALAGALLAAAFLRLLRSRSTIAD